VTRTLTVRWSTSPYTNRSTSSATVKACNAPEGSESARTSPTTTGRVVVSAACAASAPGVRTDTSSSVLSTEISLVMRIPWLAARITMMISISAR